MKRVLVIGTSHSEATCRTAEDSNIERITDGRWHDYFKKYGCEVTSLARAGCTAQQQLLAVHSYLQMNPDERWDFAIVEGRALETNVSVPSLGLKYDANKSAYEYNYLRWQTELHATSQLNIQNIDPVRINEYPEWKGYYTDYVFSYHHALDVWSTNYALCSLLDTVTDNVKWFTFNLAKQFKQDSTLREMLLGKDLMSNYILDDSWPSISTPLGEKYYCHCGHMNLMGHADFWNNHVYPRVKNYI